MRIWECLPQACMADERPVQAHYTSPSHLILTGLLAYRQGMSIRIAALYKFAKLPGFQSMQVPLLSALKELGVKGSILLAPEGVNGTIAARSHQLDLALAKLSDITGLPPLECKFSESETMPFKRMKVRLKKEIVTIGNVAADPNEKVGTYVEPENWNELIADPDVIVIDTRNSYEFGIGTFQRAIDPHTKSFSEFPAFVREKLNASKSAKIAMFCTGGIRCEKASSFMKFEGYENVYHLKGGILKYLEVIPRDTSLWNGSCFVFDERVAVDHGLTVSNHSMCHGCLLPVSAEERASPLYEEGVCCPKCAADLTEKQKASNRERQHQFMLAEKRGQRHLGQA